MAMNRSGHRPGGGIASRNVRNVTAPKVEPKPHARNPGRVGQWGQMQGDHVTTLGGGQTSYRGEPDFTRRGYATPVGPTDNVKAVGVGGGRTIYQSGTQCQTGTNPGNPRPNPRREALEQE
jgi:hypothetical protein